MILNFDKADEIRDRLDQGISVSELAKIYGVSDATISRIKHKEAWYDYKRDLARRQRRAEQKFRK